MSERCRYCCKSLFRGGRTKFLRTADAFYERRREGPYRFIQNRPGTSIVALKSDTAAEKSKDQLSRDFSGRSIFEQQYPPQAVIHGESPVHPQAACRNEVFCRPAVSGTPTRVRAVQTMTIV